MFLFVCNIISILDFYLLIKSIPHGHQKESSRTKEKTIFIDR
jgi:hypothetical protein